MIASAEDIWESFDSDEVQGANHSVAVPRDVYGNKLTGKHDFTDSEIREAIKNADEAYKNDNRLYMWVIYVNGKLMHLRGKYVANRGRILIGTGYGVTRNQINNLKNRHEMYRTYP